MDQETKAAVVKLAVDQAREWFPIQLEVDVPELDPGEAWAELNRRYPDNEAESHGGPTAMDRLFEATFRATMARFWADQSEKRVRARLLGVL